MIKINGKSFPSGNNISIVNGVVYIDGKKAESNEKVINIIVDGSINKLEVDMCDTISVNGNCNTVSTTNGDISVSGDVLKNVSTTNGDVDCGNVGGKIKTTNGDIKYKK